MLAGVSGPLLDVFFVQSKLDRRGVVATKAMSQTLGHLIKITYFGAIAWLATAETKEVVGIALSIPLAATCVVLAFTGTSLSKRVLEKMSDADFRLWTKWTVLTMGVIYLGSGIWLFLHA